METSLSVYNTIKQSLKAVDGLQQRRVGLWVRHHEVELVESGGFVTGCTFRGSQRDTLTGTGETSNH